MEAVKESVVGDPVSPAEPGQDAGPVLARVLGLARGLGPAAVPEAAFLGFREAADFAAGVEELSRAVEYLQLVAAAAVDRARNQGGPGAGNGATATGWVTGWNSTAGGPAAAPVPVDDGSRNTAEFLRERLRISAVEARRRLSLAAGVLPRQAFAGQPVPPRHEELGAALAAGTVASRAGTLITLALERVRHSCDAEASARMEHALTCTAAENDPDFLVRIARRWTEALDQDGAEPSEEELQRRQGAFIRRARHGLHHLEIFATGDQFEQLLTVMNTATNPRTISATAGSGGDAAAAATAGSGDATDAGSGDATDAGSGDATDAGSGGGSGDSGGDTGDWDRRSRPQRLLDGLVGACKAALAAGGLSAAGGLRPQVMATIGYQDLLSRLGEAGGSGTLVFTGPVNASTIRKIACDADVIPVLLGAQGRILDIGRASRLFPPHLRKAIAARDGGCAFPNCTIPAPWCEAHHISYWSRGGTTGTDNGALLCSHHHHLIHKEQWTIQVRTGVPWFIPPPHADPHQKPKRNHYFRT